jgi:hypothetical protein
MLIIAFAICLMVRRDEMLCRPVIRTSGKVVNRTNKSFWMMIDGKSANKQMAPRGGRLPALERKFALRSPPPRVDEDHRA